MTAQLEAPPSTKIPANILPLHPSLADCPIAVYDRYGDVTLNDDYVVALFKVQNPTVCFNPVDQTFYVALPDGQMHRLYDEQVKKHLHVVLRLIQTRALTTYLDGSWLDEAIALAMPPEERPAPRRPLYVDTGPRHLVTLVELLKILTVRPFEVATPTEDDGGASAAAAGFEEFVRTQLEESPGDSVTVNEALAAYVEFCLDNGYTALTPRQFREKVGDAVQRQFGISKNHDTVRNGRAQRGFRNLRLKGQDTTGEEAQMGRTDRTILFEDIERCRADLATFIATSM